MRKEFSGTVALQADTVIKRPHESFSGLHPYAVLCGGAGQMTGASSMLRAVEQETKDDILIRTQGEKYSMLTDQRGDTAAFMTGVFDSLHVHIAVVNAAGIIVKANTAWKNFALQNGVASLICGEGANYFDVSRSLCSEADAIAAKTKAGMEKVLNGSLNGFDLEYTCHIATEERWFYLRIKRFNTAETLLIIEHHDITEYRRKAIIDAQEKERHFIGEELHDNVNQLLASALLTLEMVNHFQKEPDKVIEFTARAKEYTLNAMNEIRKLSHELLPATCDNVTLKDIFETLLSGINIKSQYTVQFYFDEVINSLLCQEIQIGLYRILQEQLKNILKYADADTIEITVTRTEHAVRMRTFDNGKGFDTKTVKGGIGLNNMKRRVESFAGQFILNTRPGKGCEIIVEVPYHQPGEY